MSLPRVLFCDDRKSERDAFARRVAQPLAGRLEVVSVASLEAVERLAGERVPFDAVVTDLDFATVGGGPTDGLRILRVARRAWPHAELVVLTAHPESLLPRQVLEASGYGVTRQTWLTKLADAPAQGWDALIALLEGLAERVADPHERAGSDEATAEAVRLYAGLALAEVPETDRLPEVPEMVGRSAAIRAVWQRARQVAPTPATVLISGETGTGKELVARAIHRLSGRSPMTSLNCGALSEELLASELFGHRAGAFTGAEDHRPGLLESTGDGTLFLDEIGELPAPAQSKLLRVLQEGEYRPVGASQIARSRARIIAATNRDLAAQVAAGGFRADLLDRLRVYQIELPPLRERPADIPVAAVHHLVRLSRELDRPLEAITEEALWRLVRSPWPDNLRGLINVLTRALIDLPPDCRVLGAPDIDVSAWDQVPVALPDAGGQASAAALWQRILRAVDPPRTLTELAREHGKPLACELVRLAMRHFRGLPPEADTRRLFGMGYRNWQHWAHYNGLTWDKVRSGSGSAE